MLFFWTKIEVHEIMPLLLVIGTEVLTAPFAQQLHCTRLCRIESDEDELLFVCLNYLTERLNLIT